MRPFSSAQSQIWFDQLSQGCAPFNPFGDENLVPMSPEALAFAFPAIVESHLTAGFGWAWSDSQSIDFSAVYGFKATGPVLFVGLCSNFMGTALLLGDLPPQMLHSVTGIEFMGFIWHSGRPSSFIILTLTYFVVVGYFSYMNALVVRPVATYLRSKLS